MSTFVAGFSANENLVRQWLEAHFGLNERDISIFEIPVLRRLTVVYVRELLCVVLGYGVDRSVFYYLS